MEPLSAREVHRRYAHHPVAMDDERLVIFTVPKVGCTELLRLSRRMAGHEDWRDNPHYADRPTLGNRRRDPSSVPRIMADPGWLKTAVLRDPAERLLSAYLDKFVDGPAWIANTFRPEGGSMDFDEFVARVLDPCTDPDQPAGLHVGTDPHWRPQHLVGGIGLHRDVLSDVADFVEVRAWIEHVLRKVGVWERYGESGWEGGAIFSLNTANHRTDAADRMADYYDEQTLDRVYDAYAADLELGREFGLDLRHH